MTIQELLTRLRAIGFVCYVDHFKDGGETRLIVNKLSSTPGNRIEGNTVKANFEEDGAIETFDVDDVAPIVWFRSDHIHYFVSAAIPLSRGAYEKTFRDAAEVYEELLHYFFDADSPMRVEHDFVAGPGRPAGA